MPIDDPYADIKALLLHHVAVRSRCRAVRHVHYGLVSVVGFASDVVSAELLFTSLLVQSQVALQAEGAKAAPGARARSRSFRSSFLISYTRRVDQRLAEINAAVEGGTVDDRCSLLPVLAAHDHVVDESVAQMFGELRSDVVRGGSDVAGWVRGKLAADLAQLTFADLDSADDDGADAASPRSPSRCNTDSSDQSPSTNPVDSNLAETRRLPPRRRCFSRVDRPSDPRHSGHLRIAARQFHRRGRGDRDPAGSKSYWLALIRRSSITPVQPAHPTPSFRPVTTLIPPARRTQTPRGSFPPVIATTCSSSSEPPPSRSMPPLAPPQRRLRFALEHWADESTVDDLNVERHQVARTLASVALLGAAVPAGAFGIVGLGVAGRVTALLELPPTSRSPLWMAVGVAGIIAVLTASAVQAHHVLPLLTTLCPG